MQSWKSNFYRQIPGMILVLFLVTLCGCSTLKNYFNKSPVSVSTFTKKLIYEKEGEIKVDAGLWGIAIDPERARAFVVSNEKEKVYIVDLSKKEVIKSIKVGGSPWETAFDKRRNRLYVTNGDDSSISVVDLETSEETLKVKTEKSLPFDVIYNENRDEIYVANSDSDCISIIDGEKLTLKCNVDCGDYPYSMGMDDISGKLFVSNNFDGSVSVINTLEAKEEKRITPNAGILMGLAVNNRTRRSYIAANKTNQVIIIDNQKYEAPGAFNTLENPIDICLDEKYQYVYSIHRELSMLAVLSPEKQGVLSKIEVGKGPVRVITDPVHNLIITVNNEAGTLSLIRYKVESSQ